MPRSEETSYRSRRRTCELGCEVIPVGMGSSHDHNHQRVGSDFPVEWRSLVRWSDGHIWAD